MFLASSDPLNVNYCQAQVQVRCRSGSGEGKRNKLKDFDLSYTLNLVYTYSCLLHPHKLHSTATCSILPSKTFLPLAQHSPVKLFSDLLQTQGWLQGGHWAACSTKFLQPLTLYSPVKLFSQGEHEGVHRRGHGGTVALSFGGWSSVSLPLLMVLKNYQNIKKYL